MLTLLIFANDPTYLSISLKFETNNFAIIARTVITINIPIININAVQKLTALLLVHPNLSIKDETGTSKSEIAEVSPADLVRHLENRNATNRDDFNSSNPENKDQE